MRVQLCKIAQGLHMNWGVGQTPGDPLTVAGYMAQGFVCMFSWSNDEAD